MTRSATVDRLSEADRTAAVAGSKCVNKLLIYPGDKLDNQPITAACLNARLLTSAILVFNTFLDEPYSFWATIYKTVRPMLSDRCL